MIDYDKVLSKTAVEMKPSGIRKFFDMAQTIEGVISLGVGEPDLKRLGKFDRLLSVLSKKEKRFIQPMQV